ncbi:hypothetical protein Bca52824_010369 [Brassica carinata]|uniref:Reverse transcriptase zinc-binding domain-containing protein n=1 Tax=Brassica carinata TaxID=52824 RepID=A0A8X7WDS3_BRACI|nr:hypothetical protein Bca52824_010369 [Brassica carinata]
MSHAMDKEMMAMSLEEEDEPFDMPDLPQFSSCERNNRSLIGRILNPDCQKMSNLLREMPRKWQKQGKVRGVALSKERFQFIFDNEHDLLEVLEKGVHTSNEWAIAIDRWMENPPPDFLQFINVWVQVRNIPLNHYTETAITALGERLGAVKVYVRMQIKMDVARPFKKSMVVNLPEGGTSMVYFNYERLQKRCYECQRLNHAKEVCPRLVQKRKELALDQRQRILSEKKAAETVLGPQDPLFGVLSEEQVGICPSTGRERISPEVLEEMRRYMMMATESDRLIRIDRIRSSVAAAEKDPFLQKIVLRLEPSPEFTNQIDKQKGRVFDLDLNAPVTTSIMPRGQEDKLMASAIKANREESNSLSNLSSSMKDRLRVEQKSLQAVLSYPEPSMRRDLKGSSSKSTNPRRRPYVSKRKETKGASTGILQELYGPSGSGTFVGAKRKGSSEETYRIGVNRKESWCVFGDFNDILHNGERIGGSWRSDESFAPFNHMVKACQLLELQSHGNGYTWSGNRNNSTVHSRLDRCFGNRAWFNKFPNSNQCFLDKRGSDHRPVLIHLIEAQESYRGCFRFDTRFLKVDGVRETVANAWNDDQTRGGRSVSIRLKACRRALSNLKRQLVRAQRDEETYWWQKSKEKWLQRGDQNSTFFHNSVKARRARRHIDKLVDDDGVAVFSEAAKGDVAVKFFSDLFRSSNPPLFTSWFHDLQPRVTAQMNADLTKSYQRWSEPWLEDEDGICKPPVRRQRFFDVDLVVSDVIDPHKRRWNTYKLYELFIPSDVKILLRNQPTVSTHDSWVWKFTRSGLYTVNTGYDLAFHVNKKELLQCHTEKPSLNPLKAQVWQVQTPSKLKVFLWKALSGALPVFDALRDPGMKCEMICQTCGMDGESVNHVLFSCSLARQVWALSGFPHPPGGFDELSIFANVCYLLKTWHLKKEMRVITKNFPWILWYLWKNRNSLLFEGFIYNGEQTYMKAVDEACLWFLAQEVEQARNEETTREISSYLGTWIAPPSGFFKCNVGMRWLKKKREVGAVWVLTDSGGMTLLHSRRSFSDVWSKEEAYFLSMVWAVESMISHKCLRVYFSLEWRMLVNAINRPKAWPSFKFKVAETRYLLGELLEWRVVFENSESNREARLIANSVITGARFQSYVARGSSRWLLNYFLA